MADQQKETKPTKNVLVPVANGSEEMETVCITGTLTRFGANVVIAKVNDNSDKDDENDEKKTPQDDSNLFVRMSRGLQILAHVYIEEVKDKEWDLIVCPGGELGCLVLKKSDCLIEMLKQQHKDKKLIGAICAAPAMILTAADIIPRKVTCYPTPSNINVFPSASLSFENDVVVDENIITSAGPATALQFAIQLGATLYENEQHAYELARRLLEKDYVYEYEEKHKVDQTDTTTTTDNAADDKKQAKTPLKDNTSKTRSSRSTQRTRTPNKNLSNKTPKKIAAKTPVKKATNAKSNFKDKMTTPKKENDAKKRKKTKQSRPFEYGLNKKATRDIFHQLLKPRMQKVGFRFENGSRETKDFSIFPPGVTRKNGRKRQDYFDSIKGVVEFMEKQDDGIYSKLIEFFQKCLLEIKDGKETSKIDSSLSFTPIRKLQREVIKKYPHLKA